MLTPGCHNNALSEEGPNFIKTKICQHLQKFINCHSMKCFIRKPWGGAMSKNFENIPPLRSFWYMHILAMRSHFCLISVEWYYSNDSEIWIPHQECANQIALICPIICLIIAFLWEKYQSGLSNVHRNFPVSLLLSKISASCYHQQQQRFATYDFLLMRSYQQRIIAPIN